ncbi:MAG TPA: ATP synthase F0 subunit B [Clostridiales bacterium]|nr:ATP synthase F0 subunit B [Clostridiales bacterium]
MEFTTNELIWSVINFVVFFLLLRRFLYRPVLSLLDARKAEVEKSLEAAERARQEAEASRAEYERRLAEARTEAQNLVSRAQASAEKTKTEILDQASRQAEEMIERARKAIASEKERALNEVRQELAELAVLAASKVIERSLDVEEHRGLVNDLVKKLPEDTRPADTPG